MTFSTDFPKLKEWMPLVMEGSRRKEKLLLQYAYWSMMKTVKDTDNFLYVTVGDETG
jgi:hypothetical protein